MYQRGALTLHALRHTVGDTAFFGLLREWTRTYRDRTVRTEQFEAMAHRHANRPLDKLLRAWLHEHPLPPLPSG